jgi:hypothetical protein
MPGRSLDVLRNRLDDRDWTFTMVTAGDADLVPLFHRDCGLTRGELVTRFSIRGGGAPDVDLGYQGHQPAISSSA